MHTGFKTGTFSHFFKQRFCCGREKSFEVLYSAVIVVECGHNVLRSIFAVVVAVHFIQNIFTYIGFYYIHARHVLHMVSSAGRICLKTMFSFKCFFREFV